jgi:hypothetical protein
MGAGGAAAPREGHRPPLVWLYRITPLLAGASLGRHQVFALASPRASGIHLLANDLTDDNIGACRRHYSSDEIALLMPRLKATIGVAENTGGPMCHFPIHGIRIGDGEDIIFQTSICYECGNFYMPYPYG